MNAVTDFILIKTLWRTYEEHRKIIKMMIIDIVVMVYI